MCHAFQITDAQLKAKVSELCFFCFFLQVVCDQKPEWLDPNERPPLTIEDLAGWICIGDVRINGTILY